MKKVLCIAVAGLMSLMLLAGCGSQPQGNNDTGTTETTTAGNPITVISREEGSGTRGAFIELFGIEQENEAGENVDYTIATADQTNSTGVMLTSVAQNPDAIGYVSMGVLDDSVKALDIDGVEATVENVKNGTYSVARPFNIATTAEVSDVAADFISYILSADGQAIIEEAGYIAVSDAEAYAGEQVTGKIVIAGSSSVSPVMEKLIEAYNVVNPNADIELQQSDSTTGMNSTIEGICDIGMASRDLKDSELESGLTPTVIAIDGIAVIVNNENSVEGLTSEQVKAIYTGEITNWAEVQ